MLSGCHNRDRRAIINFDTRPLLMQATWWWWGKDGARKWWYSSVVGAKPYRDAAAAGKEGNQPLLERLSGNTSAAVLLRASSWLISGQIFPERSEALRIIKLTRRHETLLYMAWDVKQHKSGLSIHYHTLFFCMPGSITLLLCNVTFSVIAAKYYSQNRRAQPLFDLEHIFCIHRWFTVARTNEFKSL